MTDKNIIRQVLEEAGLTDLPDQFIGSIHSWQCEYTDHHGPRQCLDELVDDLHDAITAGMTTETESRIVNPDTNGGAYELRTYRRLVTDWEPA